ncbi:MAG: AraC family transcriptional regulator [Lachnospiraceae bacterium]|nr:AraC family transcriptional regulator [Lachnospiraceae bacterium]
MNKIITEKERCVFGKSAEIVSREEEVTVYRIPGEDGDVVMTSYAVFPGIEIVYNDVHTQYCNENVTSSENILQINHCLEGRIEIGFEDDVFYLEPGDLAISGQVERGHESFFPTGHYHGITILIDVEKAPECLSCLLDDVDVSPSSLVRKFCSEDICFLMRADKSVEHIFSELYSVRDSIRRGYFKIKVLELMLFLSDVDISQNQQAGRRYTQSQVQLAKQASRYITEHLQEKLTIELLSNLFHVSPTQLKNCFKGVFGMSVYAYIKAQKMKAAARLLTGSSRTVLDIAGQFGYENGSKFAVAFRSVMGLSPKEYRRQNTRQTKTE